MENLSKKNIDKEKSLSHEQAIYRIDWLLTKKKWIKALEEIKEKDGAIDNALSTDQGLLFRELRIAYIYLRMGDRKRCEHYVDNILKDNETEPEAVLLKGYLLLLEERKDEAIHLYSNLLSLKEYQSKIKRILSSLKGNTHVLNLTMKKPLGFFILLPKVSFFDSRKKSKSLGSRSSSLFRLNRLKNFFAVFSVALILFFLGGWVFWGASPADLLTRGSIFF